MKKMNDDKNDCTEALAKALARSSAWRKSLAVRWPDDPRNKRASEKLDKLAVDVLNLTDEQWEALRPFDLESRAWRDGLNQTTRQIGFFHRANDVAHFVAALVQNLSYSSVDAA
jgi:hypothetical protein